MDEQQITLYDSVFDESDILLLTSVGDSVLSWDGNTFELTAGDKRVSIIEDDIEWMVERLGYRLTKVE